MLPKNRLNLEVQLSFDEQKISRHRKNSTHDSLHNPCRLSWADTFGNCINPFLNTPFWIRPNFKEAADNNWNVAIKGFQDTDCIENIVEKGEIAHFEQFHLLPQCFPKVYFFDVLKWVYTEEKVKIFSKRMAPIYPITTAVFTVIKISISSFRFPIFHTPETGK